MKKRKLIVVFIFLTHFLGCREVPNETDSCTLSYLMKEKPDYSKVLADSHIELHYTNPVGQVLEKYIYDEVESLSGFERYENGSGDLEFRAHIENCCLTSNSGSLLSVNKSFKKSLTGRDTAYFFITPTTIQPFISKIKVTYKDEKGNKSTFLNEVCTDDKIYFLTEPLHDIKGERSFLIHHSLEKKFCGLKLIDSLLIKITDKEISII